MSFRLADAYVEIGTRMGGLTKGLATAKGRLISGLSGISRSIGASLGQLSGAGGLLFGAGIGAGLTAAVKASASFEDEIRRLSVAMEDNDALVRKSTEGVRKLSRETGVTANSLAASLTNIVDAGLDAEGAMGVLNATAKASVGTLSDVQRVTAGVVPVMLAYGLEAKSAAGLMDSMVATANKTNASLEGTARAMAALTPRAAQLGIGVNDVQAALATLTQSGFELPKAMEGLAGVLRELHLKGEAARKGTLKLGVDLSKAKLQSEGLMGVVRQLANARSDETAKVANSFMTWRFLAALVKNQTKLEDNYRYVTQSGGRAQEAFGRSLETTSSRLARLKAVFSDWLVTLGEATVKAWTAVVRPFAAATRVLYDAVVSAWEGMLSSFGSFGGQLSGVGETLYKWWVDFWKDFASIDIYLTELWIVIEQGFRTIGDWLMRWGDWLLKGMRSVWAQLGSDFESAWTIIWAKLQEIYHVMAQGAESQLEDLGVLSKDTMHELGAEHIEKIIESQEDAQKNLERIGRETEERLKKIWSEPPPEKLRWDDDTFDAMIEQLAQDLAERWQKFEDKVKDRQIKRADLGSVLDQLNAKFAEFKNLVNGPAVSSAISAVSQIATTPMTISGIGRLAPATGVGLVDAAYRQRKSLLQELRRQTRIMEKRQGLFKRK